MIIALAAVVIPWSIYDQSRRSKARKALDDSNDSKLLFTNDSSLNISRHKLR